MDIKKYELSTGQHPIDEGQFDNHNGTIPSRYMGTTADKRDMAVLGKKQVLRV